MEASIALTSRLDLSELLGEIARRVTAILGCHFCTISDYDGATDVMRVLADYDRSGRRFAEWKPYALKEYPFSKRLMENQEMAVVRVSDPAADAAETAIMRRWGEKTMLLVPLVYGERSVGLLEVYDHVRERRFTHQELRLARALGGLAAVALHNAGVFARMAQHEAEGRLLAAALDALSEGLPRLQDAGTAQEALVQTAGLACRALGGVSATAAYDGRSADAGGPGGAAGASNGAGTAAAEAAGHVVRAEARARATLSLSVTLARPAGALEERVLRAVAASAVQALAALR